MNQTKELVMPSNGILPGVKEKDRGETYEDGSFWEGHGFKGIVYMKLGLWVAEVEGKGKMLGETRIHAIYFAIMEARKENPNWWEEPDFSIPTTK